MIDTYYKRNVFGISGVEFLWGLGLPVVLESTFLQLFLKSLGATSFQVGLIPAFSFLGSSVFALLSSYFTVGLAFKRGAVIYLHLVSGMSLVFFGASLFFFGEHAPVLTMFFVSYAVFSICVGMTIPVWLNYIVNIFSEERSFSGLGFMMLAQNIARLASSLLIVKFVAKYSFSQTASGGIFLAVGLLFCLGSLFFLATKETSVLDTETDDSRRSFWKYVQRSVRHIVQNRNYLIFLAGRHGFLYHCYGHLLLCELRHGLLRHRSARRGRFFCELYLCGSDCYQYLSGIIRFLFAAQQVYFFQDGLHDGLAAVDTDWLTSGVFYWQVFCWGFPGAHG